jgi:hypothetical protein
LVILIPPAPSTNILMVPRGPARRMNTQVSPGTIHDRSLKLRPFRRTEVALDDIGKTHSTHGVDLERLRPPNTLGLGVDEFDRGRHFEGTVSSLGGSNCVENLKGSVWGFVDGRLRSPYARC